ncbi:undecaprenyl-diphosphatase [Devosia crocina]|uniref:Undecaprenyl-diphosphatase n=1 Tax=Devosia crocina TaxID=429728 RepID=A0A1I7N1Y6_9HYPH|nr:undecaprenyl-diphosphate phosphatase [Devosia crocina]SFV28677.1 undecaprenyl-diphosphatase [Devosia crocina]
MNVELVFLALVQGITEFLPVSSSGHLILGRALLNLLGLAPLTMTPAEELSLDIALHIGSLGAILVYFWRDIAMLLGGLRDTVLARGGVAARTLWVLIVASLPLVVAGLIFKDLVTEAGRSVGIIAVTTLVFGVLLFVADRRPSERGEIERLSFRDALIVGLAQCLAIIPGVSRSGICMTAGRFIGLDRPLSARLAMLMAIPAILGAGLLTTLDLVRSGDANFTAYALWGGALAFISALASIALLMKWLARQSYTPFVIYRVALGLILLGLLAANIL